MLIPSLNAFSIRRAARQLLDATFAVVTAESRLVQRGDLTLSNFEVARSNFRRALLRLCEGSTEEQFADRFERLVRRPWPALYLEAARALGDAIAPPALSLGTLLDPRYLPTFGAGVTDAAFIPHFKLPADRRLSECWTQGLPPITRDEALRLGRAAPTAHDPTLPMFPRESLEISRRDLIAAGLDLSSQDVSDALRTELRRLSRQGQAPAEHVEAASGPEQLYALLARHAGEAFAAAWRRRQGNLTPGDLSFEAVSL